MARSGFIIPSVVAIVAVSGIALAATQHGEKEEVSSRKIDLKRVPHGAMAGAAEQVASVSGAELVKLKDGRTVYELSGRTYSGEALDVYVSDGGLVVGTEDKDDDD